MTPKKIVDKRNKIEQLRAQIAKSQEQIEQLQKEIELLEAAEFRDILKEVDMSLDEVREKLRAFKAAEEATGNANEEGGDGV